MAQKNYIKRIVVISIIHFIISISVSFLNAQTKTEDKLVWHTDLMKANEVAQKTNKPIFALFTGSDWCIWCKRLQADVFAKKEFIEWAQKNVVLLEVDFPRSKVLPPEQAQQNNSLQQTFSISGYPTVWMFNLTKSDTAKNFNINTLGSLGYPAGAQVGKEEVKFLSDADTFLKKK
jgi:thioredoxin-related protein